MNSDIDDMPEFDPLGVHAYKPAPAPVPDVIVITPPDDADRRLAIQCLETWGEFVEQKDALRELAEKQLIYTSERYRIRDLVRQTERKVAKKIKAASALQDAGVDWADARVERYVVALTSMDLDRSQDRNNRGWSRAHSSTGHWCYAMLSRDRALALKVARTIVGGYVKQIEGRS